MPGCAKQAPAKLESLASNVPRCAPSKCNAPAHGKAIQHAHMDGTAPLNEPKVRHIQQVIGKLLCRAGAADPTTASATIDDLALTATRGAEATPKSLIMPVM